MEYSLICTCAAPNLNVSRLNDESHSFCNAAISMRLCSHLKGLGMNQTLTELVLGFETRLCESVLLVCRLTHPHLKSSFL